MSGDPTLERIAQGEGLALCAAGNWTARFAPALERIVSDAEKLRGSRPHIFIDVSQVASLDTFGAWLIERLRRSLSDTGAEAEIAGLSANYSSLVDEVRRVDPAPKAAGEPLLIVGMLEQIGRTVAGISGTIVGLVDMLGAVLAAAAWVLIHPRSFRFTSTVHHLEQVCLRAVPIVAPGGSTGVLPSIATVNDGTYTPLSRPIFIYVKEKSVQRPEVRKFVEFYLKEGGALTREVGFVDLPAAAYELALKNFNDGKLGTGFGGKSEVGLKVEELLAREGKL